MDYVPGLSSLFGSGTSQDANLLGQHTVRMSPISTAHLNPYSETFCLAAPGQSVLIPVVLNNTNPTSLRYTLTPLGYSPDSEKHKASSSSRVERFELTAKDLKAIEQVRLDSLQVARVASSAKRDTEDYDEYDDEDEDGVANLRTSSSTLQKTQSLAHIRLTKPGVLRLDRVMDNSGVDARLVYPTEVTVAPCPRVEFVDDGALALRDNIRCAAPGMASGAGEELQLKIHMYGVPPLSLRWFRELNGKRESFMVEGIEEETRMQKPSQDEGRRVAGAGLKAPQQLTVPLTIALDALGTHTYILESVTDALGNMVTVAPRYPLLSDSIDSKVVRATTVLRRPTVSFKGCGVGNPIPLLIGQDAPVRIATKDADVQDAPWDIMVKYAANGAADGGKGDKRTKPWTQTLTTEGEKGEVTFKANAPGEYAIVGIKGKYCEGDVLSPDTCTVVEKPLPSATIEWKKIHEWCVCFLLGKCCTHASAVLAILVYPPPSSCTGRHHSKSTTPSNETRRHPKSL